MAPALPIIKQVPSPNDSPTPIAHDFVIVHPMASGHAGSVNRLRRAATQASADLCMNDDGSGFSQHAPLGLKALAECEFNGRGGSIEAPGLNRQGRRRRDAAWARARSTAWLMRAYGIPCQHAEGGQGRGFCSHHDLGQTGGGHVDICGVNDATWVKFEGLVKAEYDAFGEGPLPPWALHQVELPPDVAPAPSHGGAPRSAPGDTAAHPTASGYPHGSAADMQWRPNQAGATPPLAVDGAAGPATRAALVAFQKAPGLAPDGVIGPATWAALDAATA